MFLLCPPLRGGGILFQVCGWGGGYPIPGLDSGGYPPGQVWMVGSTQGTLSPPGLDGVSAPPAPGLGGGGTRGTPPHHQDWIATRQAVCLLRSRRRTFLFVYIFSLSRQFDVLITPEKVISMVPILINRLVGLNDSCNFFKCCKIAYLFFYDPWPLVPFPMPFPMVWNQ